MLANLQDQIEAAAAGSGAEMGISLRHIESGDELHHNADESYPMASVLKIPVLCEAFHQMAKGAFTLDDRWELTYPLKNIGSGILTYMEDGLQPTVRDLLTLMIIISDNTATDMAMRRLGVDAVDRYMKQLGVGDIHLAFDIRGIFDDLYGREAAEPSRIFANLGKDHAPPPMDRTGHALRGGPTNNTATARAMTTLCAMIYRGEVVDRSACDEMLRILLQQTLNQRLPRFLPYGVPFAHKTGTLSGIRNDAGILYATPTDHIAITIFARWDAEAVGDDKVLEWERMNAVDSAFGTIGKAVYDWYKEA